MESRARLAFRTKASGTSDALRASEQQGDSFGRCKPLLHVLPLPAWSRHLVFQKRTLATVGLSRKLRPRLCYGLSHKLS